VDQDRRRRKRTHRRGGGSRTKVDRRRDPQKSQCRSRRSRPGPRPEEKDMTSTAEHDCAAANQKPGGRGTLTKSGRARARAARTRNGIPPVARAARRRGSVRQAITSAAACRHTRTRSCWSAVSDERRSARSTRIASEWNMRRSWEERAKLWAGKAKGKSPTPRSLAKDVGSSVRKRRGEARPEGGA